MDFCTCAYPRALGNYMKIFVATTAVIMGAGAGIQIDLNRCADAKARNPSLLAVVAVVSSRARDFNSRSKLRQNEFKDALTLNSRTIFRPSVMPEGTLSGQIRGDSRPVCVQPLFVLSPWLELRGADFKQAVTQDEWRKIIAESKKYQDVLIAPAIIDARTRARELMHVLEWSHQTVPWADYVVSIDTSVRVDWARMIELFPPPVPQTRLSYALWQLGTSDLSINALFFKDPRDKTWKQCADVSVSAFSRDLVRHMTGISFATQIFHALRHPFRMHQARCKRGMIHLLGSRSARTRNLRGRPNNTASPALSRKCIRQYARI